MIYCSIETLYDMTQKWYRSSTPMTVDVALFHSRPHHLLV